MKKTPPIVMAVLMIAGFACSNESEPPDSQGERDDLFRMDASAETRSQLGVVAWGLDTRQPGATRMRGYDASNAQVVRFDQRASKTGFFEASLETKGHKAKMKLKALADSSQLEMFENTFETDTEARKVLARIVADLETQPGRGGKLLNAPSQTLQASGLHPNEIKLVSPVGCLTTTCEKALVAATSSGANATNTCATGSSDCRARVDDTSRAAGDQNSECKCTASNTQCENKQVDIEGPSVQDHVQAFANDACCSVEGCKAGTYNGHQPSADLALDMLTSDAYGQVPSDNHAFGDRLADFALSSKEQHKVEYVIYRQRINFGDGWSDMEDRGSITQNHFDHVHISFFQ